MYTPTHTHKSTVTCLVYDLDTNLENDCEVETNNAHTHT